jgi:hypothetical protein
MMRVIQLLGWIAERQGNGQNSGGSGGGGFSGGGGGGNGSGFFLLSLLLAGHGAGFGVLLVLVLVYFAFSYFAGGRGFAWHPFGSGGSFGGGYSDPQPIPSSGGYSGPYDDTRPVGVPDRFRGGMLDGSDSSASTGDVDSGVAAITAHDPKFEPEAFVAQAQTMFFTIQQAWMECKPEMSRAVMADGLAQQTAMQLEEYRRDNRRNRLDGLTVSDARIVGAHSDNVYDTITVRFSAASADYDVDAGSGRYVKGHQDVQPWTEDWIFQRSSGAMTKPEGLLTHKCPNCGAPINVNAQGICEYCGQQVMSGKYDWVLSRIDQIEVAYSSGW